MILNDESYMRLALQMAEQALGQTGINPVVGCVVVKDGRIVGLGSHLKRGTPHAEVHALSMAGAEAEGSTVYVTLEPCSHHGLTPPCSEKLIRDKVKRVVVACTDPDPRVSGKGIDLLKRHGIEVEVGLLAQEGQQLNEMFIKFVTTRRPFVALKTASTLDGKIASKTGDSKWISGEASRAFVHSLRHRHQAIMVGVDTVLADNPQLTARLAVPAIDPIRIIVDSRLRTPPEAAVLDTAVSRTIILTTEQAPESKVKALESQGVEVVPCGGGSAVDLPVAMNKLGQMEIGSILLEGGGRLNGSMLTAKLIDKAYLFFAPKIIGGGEAPSNFTFAGFSAMRDAVRLRQVKYEQIGDDLCVIGYPSYEGGDV
jgi:diaminohydroxyphosphoribosylaminopyrimidine deaminase/5-amino-6-(5-phosphoribosylamino)uracil reductase